MPHGTHDEHSVVIAESICRHDHIQFELKTEVVVQGDEDPQDALNYKSFFAKEPLITWLFCGK